MSETGHNLSASRVKLFAGCPLRYWFRYVEGKEQTKADKGYLALGSRVHEAIEKAIQEADPPPFPPEKAMAAMTQNIYNGLGQYDVPNDMYDDGLKYCEMAATYLCDQQPDIIGVEERVEYDITRSDFQSGFTAIMDICTETDIWDWKTGRAYDSNGNVLDRIVRDEKIQGAVYMAAYYDRYGRKPERIRFVYLKEDSVRSVKPTDDVWEYMLNYAKKLRKSQEEDHFPGKPGGHCHWCSFEFWCPDAPNGMGNVPWSQY